MFNLIFSETASLLQTFSVTFGNNSRCIENSNSKKVKVLSVTCIGNIVSSNCTHRSSIWLKQICYWHFIDIPIYTNWICLIIVTHIYRCSHKLKEKRIRKEGTFCSVKTLWDEGSLFFISVTQHWKLSFKFFASLLFFSLRLRVVCFSLRWNICFHIHKRYYCPLQFPIPCTEI